MHEKFIARQPIFDLHTVTGAAKVFINLDLSPLQCGAARLLPADRVIIELLEFTVATSEVIELCKDLCAAGYILALDDSVGHPM